MADAADIKTFVQGEVAKIKTINYEIVTTLPTADAAHEFNTCRTIFLKEEGAATQDIYSEYICVNKAKTGTANYVWEKIGDTRIDLSGYLTTAATVAGVAFGDDKAISTAELTTALNLKALSHKDSASGTVSIPAHTATGSTAEYTPAGTVTVTLNNTATDITSTGKFTPAGTITGSAISGGSINVTLKDADTSTAIESTGTITTAGSVNTTTVNALTGATFVKDSTGVQITGSVSKPDVNITYDTSQAVLSSVKTQTPPSFTEGAFTPAAINTGFFSAGSLS